MQHGLASRFIALAAWKRRFGDWRVKSIMVSATAALLLTIVLYLLQWLGVFDLDPARHLGAVFAGWVAGVALFIIVGVVVGIVSLADPEDEPARVRARYLFRRQTGDHIEYILDRIGELFEPYVESNHRKLTVTEYHESTRLFRIVNVGKATIRGYVDDVTVTYKSAVTYMTDTPAPPNGKPCCLTYMRVQGQPVGTAEDFVDSFRREVEVGIPASASCCVEHQLEYWVRETYEPNRHSTIRYTQKHVLEIENHLRRQIRISVRPRDGAGEDFLISPMQSAVVFTRKGFRPTKHLYDFRIEAV